MNTGRFGLAGAGTQTATIAATGGTNGGAPTSPSNASESFNGTSWTSTSPINTTRRNARGTGLQTAALIFGGQVDGASPNKSAATESWNGSSWTTVNSLNTARRDSGGAGLQTAALAFGGGAAPGTTGATESWNGTSWTTLPATMNTTELWNGTSWTSNPNSMALGRNDLASSGTQASALASGGNAVPGIQATTEEFTGPGVEETKTVTVS
jgi:hypothetical protein